MARSIFTATDLEALIQRLNRLTPDARPQWGQMSAPQMICHLADAISVNLGEIPAAFTPGPLANPIVRWLLAYVVPFPKAKAQTAPEMLTTRPSDWDADLLKVRQQLRAAAQLGPEGAWAPHPAFGAISGKMHGVFIHKHVDHHLRQFGV